MNSISSRGYIFDVNAVFERDTNNGKANTKYLRLRLAYVLCTHIHWLICRKYLKKNDAKRCRDLQYLT